MLYEVITNHDASHTVDLLKVPSGEGNVVEQAESHGPVRLGMVSGSYNFV